MQHYQVMVIGFGKAGKTIAMKRAKAGDSVVLIEQDPKMYGGTCINVGCVPTKKLLTEAHVHELVGDKGDIAQAQERRDSLIAKMNAANLNMQENAGVVVITGKARFTGEKTVIVEAGEDSIELSADTIIINTGAEPVYPPIPGVESSRVYNSTQIQHQRPKSLAIIGGGPIGLEFATLFSTYGTPVTIIDQANTPLARFEPSVAEQATKVLKDRGITFINSAQVQKFEESDEDITVVYEVAEQSHSLSVDAVLLAVGRKPATAGLDLDKAGIATGKRGEIVVNEYLETSVPGVYAAGDVNGGPQFTYISFDDHRIIMDKQWGKGQRSTAGRVIPTATFIEPPLATVGMTSAQVKEQYSNVVVKQMDIADMAIVPRPKIVGQTAGTACFVIDGDTDLILGASLFCLDSHELINTVAVAMRHGITASELGDGIYTHPATSELFNAVLG